MYSIIALRKENARTVTAYLSSLGGRVFPYFPEDMPQHQHGAETQDEFCSELCVGQAVEREKVIQYEQRGNLQNQFSHDGKEQGVSAKAQSLEYTYSQKIYAEECEAQAKAPEKTCAIGDNGSVLHEQS